jgi:inosine triphosphate pyrophosphatase
MPLHDLYFISGNYNKLSELRAILGGLVNVRLNPLSLTEIQGSIEEIAVDKCRRASNIVRSKLGL